MCLHVYHELEPLQTIRMHAYHDITYPPDSMARQSPKVCIVISAEPVYSWTSRDLPVPPICGLLLHDPKDWAELISRRDNNWIEDEELPVTQVPVYLSQVMLAHLQTL